MSHRLLSLFLLHGALTMPCEAVGQLQRLSATPVVTLDGKNVVAATIATGLVVVPAAFPGTLSAFDLAGRPKWSRAVGAKPIGGIAVSGDTIASLESDDGWELALYRVQDGHPLRRINVDVAPGSEPFLIGGSSNRWIITISQRFTPPPLDPLVHPVRSIISVGGDSNVDTLLVVVDSSVQVRPPLRFGRAPIRGPFATITSSAASPAGDITISTGWELLRLRPGAGSDTVRFSDLALMTVDQREIQIDAWILERARSFGAALRADTLLRRLAKLDTTTRRLAIGKIAISSTGDLVVVRRDLARIYGEPDSVRIDLLQAGSDRPSQTIRIGPNDVLLAFDGAFMLTARIEPTGPSQSTDQQLIVWRLAR